MPARCAARTLETAGAAPADPKDVYQAWYIGAAVLMSEENYDSLTETLELLSIPGFRDSIKRSVRQAKTGQTHSMSEVFGEKS